MLLIAGFKSLWSRFTEGKESQIRGQILVGFSSNSRIEDSDSPAVGFLSLASRLDRANQKATPTEKDEDKDAAVVASGTRCKAATAQTLLIAFFLPVAALGQLPQGLGWYPLKNTIIQPVCPPDNPKGMYADTTMTTTTWYQFSQNCKYWFDAWSGGAVDDVHQQLILFGGGHGDSENNMVLTLDLNPTPAWHLHKSPTIPVPYPDSKNWEGLQPYFVRAADGGHYLPGASPSSRHSYAGLQYLPSQNKMFSFGGALEHGGMMSNELWTLDMGGGTWTLTSPYGKAPGGAPTTAYNPKNGHVVLSDNNWGLYDYDPVANTYTRLTNNANYGGTYHSSAAIDPVHNYFVFLGTTGGTAPAYDYYPGNASTQVVRAFDLSGSDRYATHIWDNPSCNLINAYTGFQWDSALRLLVGYPGGGNRIFLLNAGPTNVSTAYGQVPSHKCLTVTIGTRQGVDYPQDPQMMNGSYYTGENQRFGYFPSLDVFVLVNHISANAWILRLNNKAGPSPSASAASSSLSISQSSRAATSITTAVNGGFNSSVNLSASGAPIGATVAFNPTAFGAPGAGTLTMTNNIGRNTPAGTYPITVTATGGGLAPTTTSR